MIFITIAASMLLAAIACLAVPLWWRRTPRDTANVGELKEHKKKLAILERQLKKGELRMPEYMQARKQLEEALQGSLSAQAEAVPVTDTATSSPLTAVVISILLPLFAIGMYLLIGNWRVATRGMQAAELNNVSQMVANLAKRLNTTDSNDANGWMMLGQSYVVMGRYAAAVPAYAHAYSLTGDGNPDLLAEYAEAIILADPSKLTTDAAPLLIKALQVAPDNAKALWYGGLLAFAEHDKTLAIQRWQKLLTQNPPPGIRQLVVKQIEEAGGKVASQEIAKPAGQRVIPVHVSIDPRLAKQVPTDTMLFVFVRPTGDSSGPPLLATRMLIGKLPTDLELTDANAMMPGTTLASYSQVDVIARLSLKGDATAQSGDMEGNTLFKFAPKRHVANIIIDRVIP